MSLRTFQSPDNTITVMPNPTNGLVNVHFEQEEVVTVRVRDISGRNVFYQEGIQGPTFSFELKEAPGLYMVQVQSGTANAFFKIVKVN